jgi:hypothetical protein
MNCKLMLLLVLIGPAAPAAYAEPWLCTDAAGNKAYNYEPESAQKKNCVDHPIPQHNVWRATPSDSRARQSTDFPRIDAKSQKQRDAFRRRILERELAEEQKSLAAAVRELAELKQARVVADKTPARADLKNYEDRIRVHQTNIGNLQKELGREG